MKIEWKRDENRMFAGWWDMVANNFWTPISYKDYGDMYYVVGYEKLGIAPVIKGFTEDEVRIYLSTLYRMRST